MPRKGPIPKRDILPDPRFRSRLVTQFVNRLMRDGKKSVAEKIFYSAVEDLAQRTSEDPLRAFEQAVNNVKPHLE
ncbi:MAG: 30S ribosomal protein S7, partial [Desulfohalobiaceae bacterium]